MTLINLGPVMWRCTNGAPNYRTTWWVRASSYTSAVRYSMPVYPAVVFSPWHRGCLSECNPLGQSSHSFNIGIEFWKWRWAVIIGRTDNVKTQAEIDATKTE